MSGFIDKIDAHNGISGLQKFGKWLSTGSTIVKFFKYLLVAIFTTPIGWCLAAVGSVKYKNIQAREAMTAEIAILTKEIGKINRKAAQFGGSSGTGIENKEEYDKLNAIMRMKIAEREALKLDLQSLR